MADTEILTGMFYGWQSSSKWHSWEADSGACSSKCKGISLVICLNLHKFCKLCFGQTPTEVGNHSLIQSLPWRFPPASCLQLASNISGACSTLPANALFEPLDAAQIDLPQALCPKQCEHDEDPQAQEQHMLVSHRQTTILSVTRSLKHFDLWLNSTTTATL